LLSLSLPALKPARKLEGCNFLAHGIPSSRLQEGEMVETNKGNKKKHRTFAKIKSVKFTRPAIMFSHLKIEKKMWAINFKMTIWIQEKQTPPRT
jgi:hypothetical protein